MDSTRTYTAHAKSAGRRMDKKTRQAQARLADKSFSTFMREHNAKLDRIVKRGV